MTSVELLRDFELLLVRRHRFALADVVLCMQSVVRDLQILQRAVTIAADAKSSSPQTLHSRLERVVGLVPTFLGERELKTLLAALQEFTRGCGGPETHGALQKATGSLVKHSEALAVATTRCAAVCTLLTQKRDHLEKFLDEAAQVLQNSHSRRVEQYQDAIERLTEEFKETLQDEHLQHAQQLRYGIQAIETSMSTMLLPHFEICRTITTANAQVQAAGSAFSRAECDDIGSFVQTAAKLKSGGVTFRSVLQDAPRFLAQLSLFQQAASKDAFLVCSSALKLQFREALDQELFLAYVEDWTAKRNAVQLTEASSEYRAATSRLQELKAAIGRAHELGQASKEKLALDDPARLSLAQEVARIFQEEGGEVKQVDL